MTGATTLIELAERCERLTGPCRETDVLILIAALGYRDVMGDGSIFDRGNDGYWTLEGDEKNRTLPSPTASLDAALTLVPETYDWRLRHTNGGLTNHAKVGGNGREYERFAETPALALCAAALRARAAIASAKEQQS